MMRRALILALGTALAAGLAEAAPPATAPAAAMDPSVSPPGWAPPRTSWGAPDISGHWSNATLTPMTRNRRLTDKPTLSVAEARAQEAVWAKALEQANEATDPNASTEAVQAKSSEAALIAIRPDFAAAGGDVGGYNAFWLDPGTHIMQVNGQFRTSIITTPDGQIPKRKAGAPPAFGQYRDIYDSYEVRSLGDRCIMGFGRNGGIL